MVSRGQSPQFQIKISTSWRRRARAGVLIVLVMAGLAIAALEKYRTAEANEVWTNCFEQILPILEPTRAQTRRWVTTAFRMNELWGVEAEKERLARELARTRLQNDLLAEQVGRLQRLSGLGTWAAPPKLRFVQADITSLITSDESMLLTINRGRADGISPRDPVVALDGLVGMVRSVQEHTAQVQALTDPMSVVGVATRDTRARGALYGRGRGKPLEFLPENEVENFGVGSRLITSRFENSNFPKGITIGVVEKRDLNLYGIPVGVVRSAVSFDTLEEVLVITPNPHGDDNTTDSLGSIRIVMPRGDELAGETTGTLNAELMIAGPTARNRHTTSTLELLYPTTGTLYLLSLTSPTLQAANPTTATLRSSTMTSATTTRRTASRDSSTTGTRRRARRGSEGTQ